MPVASLMTRRLAGGAPPTGGGSAFTANVSALPVANRQRPDWAWYASTVRNAAAGTVVTDPVLGQTLLKLTSASSPITNASATHDYSNGGPQFSVGFGTNSANVTTMVKVGSAYYLVDLLYNNGSPQISNWRTPPYTVASDLMFGFSRTAPHIMYLADGGYLRKINTQTNTEITGGVWPKNLSAYLDASSLFNWIQVTLDDSAIAMQPQQKSRWLVYYPGSDTVKTWTKAQLDNGLDLNRYGADGFDECHISDYGTYGEVIGGAVYERKFLELASGRFTAQTGDYQFTHTAAVSDSAYAGISPGTNVKPFWLWPVSPITVDGQAATTPGTVTSGPNGFNAAHTSAYFRRSGGTTSQYVCGAAEGTSTTVINGATWTVHSGSIYKATSFSTDLANLGYEAASRGVNDIWERASDSTTATVVKTLTKAASVGAMTAGSFYWDSGAGTLYLWATNGAAPGLRHILAGLDINNQAIALCKLDGTDIRMQQFTYTLGSNYFATARAHISPNGLWTMWTTDHGVHGGRLDVMVHLNPVTTV